MPFEPVHWKPHLPPLGQTSTPRPHAARDGAARRLYAVPFYGESSLLMYRKDLFEQAGITMPERPTWDQIAEYAAKLKDPASDRAGSVCAATTSRRTPIRSGSS